MKTKRVLLLMMLCAAVFVQSSAQTTMGRQKVDQYPITAWGTPTYGLTWLPTDYNTSTTKYPLIIFLHGSGEGGDGVGGLNNLLIYGLPNRIANGWDPQATNPADGQNYKFIVVSPQAPSAAHWSYAWGSIQWILADVVNRYRIDTTRIYVTGISAGGAGTWSCVTNGFAAAQKFPAIVPVSAAGTNSPAEQAELPLVGGTYGAKVWNVCGANDAWYAFAQTATNTINNAIPAPSVPAIVTAIPGTGHDPGAWNTPYDPNWRSNTQNLSIYEWMLKYKRTTNAPTASAGTNQNITLPTSQVTLNGSGTAASGNTIASYAWTKTSGPASYTIASPSSASTLITGLTQGSYGFRLTVTDNLNVTATSDVTVMVNPVPNILPVANAGSDQSITLPLNNVSLNGSGTDADGTIASYLWTKISGPAQYAIVNSASAATTVNNLLQGTYQFELKVTDNQGGIAKDTINIIVNPAPNVAPSANAGSDQAITLPTNTVTLSGSGTDTDGTIASYLWTKISGPAQYAIVNAASAATTVNNLVQGTYQFELKVTDNIGATGKDTVNIIVNPAPNVAPSANAGVNQSITLPTNTVTLNGSGADTDGSIASYKWTKVSGPAQYAIVASTNAQTAVNNLVQGVYEFELLVTDNSGAIAKDTMSVTVNPAPPPPPPVNIAPVANAGTNITTTLPADSALLQGSGTDADGTIASYNWIKISGPSQFVIATAGQAQTKVNNLLQGVYQFELTVTDNTGATGKDTVSVTVNAAPPPPVNIPPVAHAGTDQGIVLPQDSTSLTGSGSDADGTVASYSWTKISGPASYTIASPSQAQTMVKNLVAGVYQFELSVRDNAGADGKDTISITVSPAPPPPPPVNIAPVANAGNDTIITLPVDSILLQGNGTDTDGSITAYLWKKISGPSCIIPDSTHASMPAKSMVQGIYQFELTVTDNSGAVGRDTVQVTVMAAANVVPVVFAGADTTIVLPVNTITLQGTATDADGSIVSYSWSKVSGPAQYNIISPSAAQTVINNLLQGVYTFELMVTDNVGAVSRDTITVTVNANTAVTGCNGVRRYIVPGGDGGKYILNDSTSMWYMPVNPGDTIVLRSQYSWNYFSIDQYSGTASCPIVIMNEGGQVWLTAGIEAKSCKYLKVTGSGDANTYYGIKVYNPGNDGAGVALSITGKSKVIEVERVDVYKKTYGVWAKQDPLCDQSFNYPNYTMDSIEIHHSRFKNIGQDCIYAGNTDPLGTRVTWCNGVAEHYIPMRLSNINLHHLIIDSCNRTGIQLGGAEGGYNQIHDNIITRCGYEYNQQQGTGIAIGGMTRNCHVYNNTIRNTFLYGIMSFGVGVNYIENNNIDSTGWLNGVANTWSRPCNILASPKQTIPFDSTTIIIRNNRLGLNSTIDSTNLAVVVWGPATWTVNNVVCNNTKLDGTTPAHFYVDPTVHYINDCSVGLPNMGPTAFAGNDITINPPADSTTLDGNAIDPDGTIISYHWQMISGPAQYTIAQPDSAHTSITGLVQGVYTFRLTVMDDDSLVATDDIQLMIAPPNVAPIANAGANQMITLPLNVATMDGNAIDYDGTVVSYLWTKISGPASGTIANAANPQTQVTGLVQGTYQFELLVTDNSGLQDRDTVNIKVVPPPPPTNIAPVANAGINQTIVLPNNYVTLNGSGTDADGTVVSYLWTKLSGPASFGFTNATQPQTVAGNLTAGTYQFVLTVTDNQGATGKDTVIVVVNPAPNVAPVANAGTDKVITLPVNTVSLSGSGTDADGTITSYQWTKISGPATYAIATPAQAQSAVNNLVAGIYKFELRVVDNDGAAGRDTVTVTVNAAPPPNVPPVANAGNDQVITLPVNTVTLTGSGTDADGTVVSYLWTKISGPAQFTIVTSTQPQTVINSLVQGVYQFALSVTDNSGAVAKDTVTITVNPAPIPNVPPVSNAGADQFITLPVNTATLNGSGADTDGTIASYQWTKIFGPASYTIGNPASAQTIIHNLTQGIYQFVLTVTDNKGAAATDTVNVVVYPAVAPSNVAPVANAGVDQSIVLPANSVMLIGSGSDADGTITGYSWTKISGPGQFIINTPAQAQTALNNLVEGVYKFELKVTDNQGAVGKDTVTVTVSVDQRTYSSAILYPNPATSVINIKIDAITHRNQTSIRIYDVRGVLVYEEDFLRTQQVVVKQIPVEKLLPGPYLVVLGVDINKDLTLKFIKE